MNISRLNRLVDVLSQEIDKLNARTILDELYNALSLALTQPSPDTTRSFREKFAEFQAAHDKSFVEKLPPSYKRGLAELDLEKYFGRGAVTEVRNIVDSNGRLPDETLKAFDLYRVAAGRRFTTVKNIDEGLTTLSADYESLEEGEFEFGLVIPDENTPSDLAAFRKETQQLERAMRAFQELVGEDPSGAKISSISASDWSFFVEISPSAAAALAFAIERIVALYKNLLEIRVLKKQAASVVTNDEIVALIQKTVDERTEKGLREIAAELVEGHSAADKERKNELENHFSMIVKWLAKHIEMGSVVEVRAEPLAAPEDGVEDDTRKKMRQLAATVNATTQVVLTADIDSDIQIFPALAADEPLSEDGDADSSS